MLLLVENVSVKVQVATESEQVVAEPEMASQAQGAECNKTAVNVFKGHTFHKMACQGIHVSMLSSYTGVLYFG